ncbi:hypothetical protein [Geothrix sp. 21YS21S-2]|uniref:hypothetical protein n=1 Tax=Geothrix sp. 21YS21S-2 TaxID=3068893 RepID=UPI0027BA2DBD|nr:hypothetical protein [Geothrix sp. 21YS21S-2]
MKFRTFAVAVLAAGSCFAASPFDGTWVLNPARSVFTGDTFTYQATPGGGIHFSNGSTAEFDFTLDGKPCATPWGNQVTWTRAGENAWNREWTFGGKVIQKGLTSVSGDGRLLSSSYTEFRPDGSKVESSEVYERVSGGPGLPGKWKNVKSVPSTATLIVAVPAPGRIRFEMPEYQMTEEGPTDGTAIPVMGPTVAKGTTDAWRVVDAGTFSFESRMGGKVMTLGTLGLAADGKSLTFTFWVPGKEDEKATAVYERK